MCLTTTGYGTIRGEIDRYRDNERMRATERVTGEVIDRPGKSERLRMIEIEENEIKIPLVL